MQTNQTDTDPWRAVRIKDERNGPQRHDMPRANREASPPEDTLYRVADLPFLQNLPPPAAGGLTLLQSIEELLARDKQRQKDGFPRKIRVGRLVKPGRGGKDKVVVVPTTVEEKLIHDPNFHPPGQDPAAGGSGDGQDGEVIGEQPVRPEQGEGSGEGPGQGEGGPHEMESSAYDLGRILSEQFELPNLTDKGKKRSLTRYNYDLTDRHHGSGQVLDKKATLRKIVQTNIGLGTVSAAGDIDTSRLLIAPSDRVYRILSREKDYESQAMVFFMRDYSGSMAGKPTQLVVAQHVLIYSWLLYQYQHQVQTRFILHDTEAREVPDFHTYYNLKVAGGTQISSAFELVNQIVAVENIAADYNIYVFHGTDGDDWDSDGQKSLPAIKQMLGYVNRLGICIVAHSSAAGNRTDYQRYLDGSGLLKEKPRRVRLDVMSKNADEPRLIEGIKKLISQ